MRPGEILMTAKMLVEYVSIAEFGLCTLILLAMCLRKTVRDFPTLAAFLALRSIYGVLTIPVLFFRQTLGISKLVAYKVYFYTFWPSAIMQTVLMVLLVYGIYSLALKPFEPLKKIGNIIFRWVAVVAVVVAIGVAISPHATGPSRFVNIVGQMQQTCSILMLCLLLFVCFALKPLGLTKRSRAFGATLGLGILATCQLIESAWYPTTGATNMYSIIYFYYGLGVCAALLVWGAYFAFPEAKRGMVLLPTTSPYFFWNTISEALGDEPGFVAVSGFTPDSLAAGELQAFIAASQPSQPDVASYAGLHIESRPVPMRPMVVN